MTQNDLYIAQAYGYKNADEAIFFDYSGEIFDGINQRKGSESTGEAVYYQFGSDKYKIYQFGIQTAPGVEISLNRNGGNVKVGQTGIWEINLSSLTPISAEVQIYKLDELLSATGNEKNLSCNYCLIDVIYSKVQSGGVSE